jgi:hypothetical protein
LQVFDSGRAEIEHVEIDQNIFAFETAELQFATHAAVQFKVWGFVANLQGARELGCGKEQRDRKRKYRQDFSIQRHTFSLLDEGEEKIF